MNNQNVSKAFIGLGTILCVGAIIWWATFYSKIAESVNDGLNEYAACLINSGDECEQAAYFAQQFGLTPYSPYPLWAGILILVLGFLIKGQARQQE